MKNWHKAKIKELSKLVSYNFLCGTGRNIENIVQGFKHYMKVMIFI